MGQLVAVGAAGAVQTSTDGITWVTRTPAGSSALNGVAYGNGLFVATGGSPRIQTSPDGLTWTTRLSGSSALSGVVYGGGRFVAVGAAPQSATSTDGITWTATGTPPSNTVAVAYGAGLYVAVGLNGTIASSVDGLSWTTRLNAAPTQFRAVTYGGGRFVAFGKNSSAKAVYTSTDGITWTQTGPFTVGETNNAIAYGGGLYVVVGDSGSARSSTDGSTWIARSTSGTKYGIVWAGTMFVAVGDTIQTSTDAIAWTTRADPSSDMYAVAVNPNVPPNAPILGTVGTIDRAVTNRFPWTFSDPDPGDSQSKFDLQWWDLDGTGARVGAAHTVSQSVPNQFYDVPAGTFTAGPKEWQVRTYDSAGVVGPYSSSGFFTAGDAPAAPTFTDPINGQTISTATYTATITAPDVDASQWRTVADNAGSPDTGTVYQDSGVLEGPVRSYTFSFPVNNRTEHPESRIRDGGLWSQWADSRNPISYTPPPDPIAVKTPVPSEASIDVAITNPAPGAGEPAVSYNNVYLSAAGIPEYRAATLVPPNSTWRHWLPASNVVYLYRVESVADNGTTSTSEATP